LPLTPFHFGPAAGTGLAFQKIFDLPTLIVAAGIIDLEPLAVLLFGLNYPYHGFFHSFLGAAIAAVAVALVMWKIRKEVDWVMAIFRLKPGVLPSFSKILFSAVAGADIFHVLVDAPTHIDMSPFWPFVNGNPLYETVPEIWVYAFCTGMLVIAAVLYIKKDLLLRGPGNPLP